MKSNKNKNWIFWLGITLAVIAVLTTLFIKFSSNKEKGSQDPQTILTGSGVNNSDYIVDIKNGLETLNIEDLGKGINL